MRKYIVLCLVGTILCLPKCGYSQSSQALEWYRSLFQSNLYFTKLLLRVSPNHFLPSKSIPGGSPHIPIVAARQPSGFFLYFPTPYPTSTPSCFGESKDYYWDFNAGGVGVAPKAEMLGGSDRNGVQISSQWHLAKLEQFLLFGIDDAEPGTVVWTDDHNFEAISIHAPKRMFRGRADINPNENEVKISYLLASLHKNVLAICRFDNVDKRFPNSVVLTVREKGKPEASFIRYYDEFEFGIPSGQKNEFIPTSLSFFPTNQLAFFTWSNGIRYQITGGGPQRSLVRDMGVPPKIVIRDSPAANRTVRNGIRILFITALVVIPIGIFFLARISKQHTNNKTHKQQE